jgi:hypothetical protein
MFNDFLIKSTGSCGANLFNFITSIFPSSPTSQSWLREVIKA